MHLNDCWNTIKLLKNGEIKDKLILDYLYYEICEEVELKNPILRSIKNYKIKSLDERKEEFKNYTINEDKENNKATFKKIDSNLTITIKNVNNYIIDNKTIGYFFNYYEKKSKNEFINIIKKPNKSIYYFLNNLEFNRKRGDKLWDEFLKTNIAANIIQLYYKDIPFNLFMDDKIIKFFKENSFYFPLNLQKKLAITQKETFKIFFGPKKINVPHKESKQKGKLWKVVDEAFYKVKIIHEWYHACQAFLFFAIKNNNIFDSPKRLITIEEKTICCDEGGETIELLLFGRIITELTFQEAIFILDINNYKRTIDQFRNDFLKINNKEKNINNNGNNKENINNEDNVIKNFLSNNKPEQYIIDGINQYNNLCSKKIIFPNDKYKISKLTDSNTNENIRDMVFKFNIDSNHNYRKLNNKKFGLPKKLYIYKK